jgi:hypothetical protein
MNRLSKKRLLELRDARINRLMAEQKELDEMKSKHESANIRNTITNIH